MTKDDFLKAIEVLSLRFDDDTWIDYKIVPRLAIVLLDAFPEINRADLLDTLQSRQPSWWNAEYSAEIEAYFSPRVVLKIKTPEGDRYWDHEGDALVVDINSASLFDDEEDAAEEHNRNPFDNAIAKSGCPMEVVEIPYPAWKESKRFL